MADAPTNPNPVKWEITGDTEEARRLQTGGALMKQRKQKRFLEVMMKGNSEYSWYETLSGHTVQISKIDGEPHYLDVDDETGALFETDCIVGSCNPDAYGILPHTVDDEEQILFKAGPAARRDRRLHINKAIRRMKDRKKLAGTKKQQAGDGDGNGNDPNRRLRGGANGGAGRAPTNLAEAGSSPADSRSLFTSTSTQYTDMTMKNLVLMIRWEGHQNRNLPSKADMEILFNQVGGHDELAPTGSVRDCFLFNSYNSFDMVSTVTDWIDVPYTEAYVGDNYYGMTGRVGMAIRAALDQVGNSINWADFDADNDGEIDAIAIIHSGFGAEAAEPDCYTDLAPEGRIWSHKWNLDQDWTAPGTGTLVWKYHISPALWGSCGSNIGRIGVICHETGHFLGAPDIYDGTGGNGVGSWGCMGNSWGFNGDQFYPPMMTPWTKMALGWINPVVLTHSGQYDAIASWQDPTHAFVIVHPDRNTEYFIIENRVRTATMFDVHIPNEGLLIWHLDDEADFNEEGHPDLIGWPESGDHYRVAVVQADGEYQLETAASRGDGNDVFHKDGPANEISDSGIYKDGQLVSPDTNLRWYQGGAMEDSGIRIFDIGYSGHTVNFKLTIQGQGGAVVNDVGSEDFTVDGPVKNTCAVNGERCKGSDECCSRHSCKKIKNSRGKRKLCCKMQRKRNKNPEARNKRNKNKNTGARKLREKRRITPLA